MSPDTKPVHAYQHVQRGWLIPACLHGAAVFTAVILFVARHEEKLPMVLWGMPLLLMGVGRLFAQLRVVVDARAVSVCWTWGWPRKCTVLADIAAAELCEHGWWYGYGIRWTPRGWLWNAQGAAGVRLILRNGKCFHIGTDDAPALLAAVNAALASTATA